MRRRGYREEGPGPLELLEEAVQLLRRAPFATLALYYLGALPFVLGGLYFWTDMARSATADSRCGPAALGVTLLFLWMKTWQSIFAARLRMQIADRPGPVLTPRRLLQVGLTQTILQPSRLLVLPAALLAALPFGWVFAFYESLTALGADAEVELRSVLGRAWRQARLWPRQNHLLLAVLVPFGGVVFLDTCAGLLLVPTLLKLFLGIESGFTRGGWSVLNTTFVALGGAVAFLGLDPLIKAVYALRGFYGEARSTGEDLRLEFRPRPGSGVFPPTRANEAGAMSPPPGVRPGGLPAVLALLILGCGLSVASPVPAEGTDPPTRAPVAPAAPISPDELARSIDRVLDRPEYAWRFPRDRRPADESQKGVFAAFMDGLLETVRSWMRTISGWLGKVWNKILELLDWVQRRMGGRAGPASGTGDSSAWIGRLQLLVWLLVAALASVAAVFLWRVWRSRRPPVEIVSEAWPARPDVGDEQVLASELPEEEWMRLARELAGEGNLRLAMRALYLASLAHLARRGLLQIARFKSNRDYERELRRRARANPELGALFGDTVTAFDRVWYGAHEVTGESLGLFRANVERIQSC